MAIYLYGDGECMFFENLHTYTFWFHCNNTLKKWIIQKLNVSSEFIFVNLFFHLIRFAYNYSQIRIQNELNQSVFNQNAIKETLFSVHC